MACRLASRLWRVSRPATWVSAMRRNACSRMVSSVSGEWSVIVQSSALAHGRCPEHPARQKIGAAAPCRYEAELSTLCVPYLRESEVPRRVFYERRAKHLAALFD